MNQLVLLGTGTCQIQRDRMASSALLRMNNSKILYDCGHGVVQRLLEIGIQLSEINHIIISHFHPDHTSDLIPFLQAGAWSQIDPRIEDVHIYGPIGIQNFINKLFSLYEGEALRRPRYQVIVHEITDQIISIESLTFDFIHLPHVDNCGLRFQWNEKFYAITGDSIFHQDEIEFIRNVDLAIIDAGHITDEEIVKLALASNAKQIVCSHLYREIEASILQIEAKQLGYDGTIRTGHDLETISLD